MNEAIEEILNVVYNAGFAKYRELRDNRYLTGNESSQILTVEKARLAIKALFFNRERLQQAANKYWIEHSIADAIISEFEEGK